MRTWLRWLREVFLRSDAWIEATTHDISILPSGQILHHSICWCRRRS